MPSLGLADEAVELFTDRARHVRPDFTITDSNAEAVTEICRRLDGMPLAIELAAARMRALSAADIRDGLHDRFQLLTGGAHTAVRRQQTLRASVDWSHSMLTDAESVLFRRLAVFAGGFDLDAAVAVCGGDGVQRYQVLDQLTLLVDKSLVLADNIADRARYRTLETIREYGLEKLDESGEAAAVRARHRDYYTALAAELDTPTRDDFRRRAARVEADIDNVRAAFAFCCEQDDAAAALRLASSLQPLWHGRGLFREGLAWFVSVLDGDSFNPDAMNPAMYARAMADRAVLDSVTAATDSMEQARRAVEIARELGDPVLLARTLTACGWIAGLDAEAARPYFDEALGLARALGDDRSLSQILGFQAFAAVTGQGDPAAVLAAGEEGRDVAEAIGDGYNLRHVPLVCGFGAVVARRRLGHHPAIPRPRCRVRSRARRQLEACPVSSAWATCSSMAATRQEHGPPRPRLCMAPRTSASSPRASPARRWPPRPWPRVTWRRRPAPPRRLGN